MENKQFSTDLNPLVRHLKKSSKDFTKEDIILAENNNPTYYQVDTFEQVKFYIKNDGTLHTTVDFSD